MAMSKGKRNLSCPVTEEIAWRFDQVARFRGVSRAELLRKLVRRELEKPHTPGVPDFM